jgi:hypothetical protein
MAVATEVEDGLVVYRLTGEVGPAHLGRLLERPEVERAIRSGFDRLIVAEASARFHVTYHDLAAYHARVAAIEARGDATGRLRLACCARTEEHRIALRLHAALLEARRSGALEVFASADEAEARAWLAAGRRRDTGGGRP